MKCVTVTVEIDCPDDIPQNVIESMGGNLGEHAAHEFERNYDPEWNDGYEGPPVAGHVTHTVSVRPRTAAYAEAIAEERALEERASKAVSRAYNKRNAALPRIQATFERG